jgi:hypothetical protein
MRIPSTAVAIVLDVLLVAQAGVLTYRSGIPPDQGLALLFVLAFVAPVVSVLTLARRTRGL